MEKLHRRVDCIVGYSRGAHLRYYYLVKAAHTPSALCPFHVYTEKNICWKFLN